VLHAKVTALVARSRGGAAAGAGDILTCGPIAVHITARRVTVEGSEIALTPKEFDLLVCLMRSPGLVMSREQLLVKCWGYDYEGDSRSVDTYIRRLRDKLGTAAAQIKTVIKSGYKLEG
jgi:DNA-binding response OmpR family regulator